MKFKIMHPLNHLIVKKDQFITITQEYGTPLYIYSTELIRENLDKLEFALKKNFKKYHICYAIKANSNPHLIKLMKDYLSDLGADCSSPGEIYAANLAGISPQECIYTGNYESMNDLQCAFESGSHINLDDINSFLRLIKIGIPEEISFRLNPGFGMGTFAQIITGGEKAKFGVPHYDIVNAYRNAKENGVKKYGIQCMTGSGVLDSEYFPELMTAILKTVKLLHDELGIQMNYISMGGGFGIPYKDDESVLDIQQVFKNVGDIYNSFFDKKPLKTPELWIEPGKSVVGDAGILLTSVTGIKESYKTFIGVDAGMETLMRPALYGAYHHIFKVGNPDAPTIKKVDITGRICENTDRLAVDRDFPEVDEGDLIAIMDVGAYGYSMSHNSNTRPRAAEVLLDGENVQLIRKRETVRDIFRNCHL